MAINFFRGHPTNSLLARKEVLQAAQRLLSPEVRLVDDEEEDRHPLTYGTDRGSYWVRTLISQWYGKASGESDNGVTPDCLVLSNGASFGAANVLTKCTSVSTGRTRHAFLVTPTYFLINDLFLDAGFGGKMTGVPETSKGLDLAFLESKLKEFEAEAAKETPEANTKEPLYLDERGNRIYRYVMYLVPTFSNPTGSTMSLEDREKLIQLARTYDMLLLCDDVYDLLNYADKPVPPRLVWVDRQVAPNDPDSDQMRFGHTVSNCTFSKLVGPGIRVGWQETVNDKLAFQLSTVGAVKSGGSPAQMNSMIAAEMVKSGEVDTVVANLCKEFKHRSKVAYNCLKAAVPEGSVIEGGDGGYFHWVTLPERYAALSNKILDSCKQQGVILAPGSCFQVEGDEKDWNRSYRFCFAYLLPDEIEKGLKVFGQVLASI